MKKKKTFEESITRLEEIIYSLERGEVPLEKSLSLFQEGAGLIADCQKQLDEAEQVVRKLRKSDSGEPEELPFGDEEE